MINDVSIVGILNVTPDSFYDGGKYFNIKNALNHAEHLIKDGADIIDVGGESTRPDSQPITEDEEISRVIPVIKEIRKKFNIPISIDTYKFKVAKQSFDVGANIINDISAFRFSPEMIELAAKYQADVIIMHMKGTPKDMQINPQYNNVVQEIKDFLIERINFLQIRGIKKEKIIIDPGIGFGKTVQHNIEILKNIISFVQTGHSVLVGVSRKSFIGKLLGTEGSSVSADGRLPATISVHCWLFLKGVKFLRVHDVKETVESLKILNSLL